MDKRSVKRMMSQAAKSPIVGLLMLKIPLKILLLEERPGRHH
jgi:hypothetical protein